MDKSLWRKLVGEFLGCWIAGFFGLMIVAVCIICGGVNLFELGMIFAMVIAFAVYLVASVSGAHLNPAVTFGFALFGGFPKKHVIPYWIAQILGWFVGSVFMYMIVGGMISAYEATNGIVRGMPGSEITAMIFNCYAPHPIFASLSKWGPEVMPTWLAIVSEAFGTMLLVTMVFAFVDAKNNFKPNLPIFALVIGLVVGFIVVITSPQTMAAINPARDLGPRITTWLFGWGNIAFPGLPSGQGGPWYIWTVGPLLGGAMGGAFWTKIVSPLISSEESEQASKNDDTTLSA